MNITTSKFYSARNSVASEVYKSFIFSYTEIHEGYSTNKWMMRNIINKTRNLSSSTQCTYKELQLTAEQGAIYLEPNDHTFDILSKYFNSKGDLNTKKAGLILLYLSNVLNEYRDSFDIGDNLTTLDGVPLINVLDKEFDEVNVDLGKALEELYEKEPLLKKANINIKYIYLNSTLGKAYTILTNALIKEGYKDPELSNELNKLTGLINNVRNKYLDSKNYHTKFNAKYLIEKHNIMSYKTYSNSYGSANKFRATLKGLLQNDKIYILNSQYACACGLELGGGDQ